MFIHSILISQFKNILKAEVELSQKVTCIYGLNGSGKTNFLEAFWYAAYTKSYFSLTDSQLINEQEKYFTLTLKGTLEAGKKEDIFFVGYSKERGKALKINQKDCQKAAEFVGKIPVIMISPTDSELITGGSEERRKFVDRLLGTQSSEYLTHLLNYGKILKFRNKILKEYAETGQVNAALLDIYDQQLLQVVNPIFKKRKEFCEELKPFFTKIYSQIANQRELADFILNADNENGYSSEFMKSVRQADLKAGRTTWGPQKDDLEWIINDKPAKKFGSQGQQKTYLLALKLASYYWLNQKSNTNPILLLDDIFDKLDEERLTFLLELVATNDFGQVLITDTEKDRLQKLFSKLNLESDFIAIEEIKEAISL